MKSALLAVLLTGCQPVAPVAESTTYRIESGESVCSATAIGPNLLLTASHCLQVDPLLLTVNGTVTAVQDVVHDGKDHAIVRTTTRYPIWAKFGPRPVLGQPVQFYGNAQGFTQLYRRGYVAQVTDLIIVVDITAGHGDSGAAVFNEAGEVIGVVSAITKEGIPVMAMFPLAFEP